jgi:hypothetical protein
MTEWHGAWTVWAGGADETHFCGRRCPAADQVGRQTPAGPVESGGVTMEPVSYAPLVIIGHRPRCLAR